MTQYDVVSYGIDFRHFAHLSFAISLFIPSSAAAAWRMASQGSRMPLVDSAKGQKCLNVAVDLKQCKIDAAAGGSAKKVRYNKDNMMPIRHTSPSSAHF